MSGLAGGPDSAPGSAVEQVGLAVEQVAEQGGSACSAVEEAASAVEQAGSAVEQAGSAVEQAAEHASRLAAEIVAALRLRAETLATTESLTGGLVGATITGVPGASAVYRGGLVTYATDLKAELAGVPPEVLAVDGPVASVTAAELARGAARVCGADWGLATTGVAGPGSQDGHPVGQVFVAVAEPLHAGGSGPDRGVQAREVRVRELSLSGDRALIRIQTVGAVLGLLRHSLSRIRPTGGGSEPLDLT